jgi:hypothetical protein
MEIVKDEVGAESSAEPKVTIPMEKFPRLCAISKEIGQRQELVDCLNARKLIIIEGEEGLSNFERNERKILLLKTDIELAKVHTSIINKKREIKDYFDKVVYPYIDVIDNEIEKLFIKAKDRAKKDGVLAGVLREINTDLFADNWEHKFNYYIAVKNYLDPRKGLKKA